MQKPNNRKGGTNKKSAAFACRTKKRKVLAINQPPSDIKSWPDDENITATHYSAQSAFILCITAPNNISQPEI
jgi:hypothetical protein